MRRSILILLLAAALSTMLSACTIPNEQEKPASSIENSVLDKIRLIDSLMNAGSSVEPGGEIEQPFFTVPGQFVSVNGIDIQVFEYNSEEELKEDADKVEPDGGSVDTTMISWIAPAHFFKNGRVLVLYMGEDQSLIDLLTDTLGEQFAGQ